MHSLGKRILVVDDDDSIRRLVATILRRSGFIVDTARDGFEAIEYLGLADYDAILLDLMMPRIDGFGVIGYLREHDIERLQQTIVMTAYAPDNIHSEAVWTILTKPFDIEVLLRETIRCMEAAEMTRVA